MNVSFSVSYISEIPPEADPSIPANIFDPTAATIYGLASEVSSNCVANSKNGVPLTTEPNPTITAVFMIIITDDLAAELNISSISSLGRYL